MDRRITEFIAALRAAGVRISLAETADAMRAVEQAGITNRDHFRLALQASLIKDAKDFGAYQELFPLYFGKEAPPPLQPAGGNQLSDEQREQLLRQLQQMLAQLSPQHLANLFRSMVTGEPMSGQEMRAMLGQAGPPTMSNQRYREWMTRQALRDLQFNKLEQALRELLEQLRQQGMADEALRAIEQAARENQQALAEQIGQEVAREMADMARGEGRARPRQRSEAELLDRPFERLDECDLADMRKIVNRLAARLRTRLALRQRRGKIGTLDAKNTIRTNQRFGGVPMVVRHRKRHLKPRLVVFCDRSVSTQHVMTFMLLMIYSLHDQLSRTRSFAFIDRLYDMTMYFAESRPEEAIERVMREIRPTRSYSTDLGSALDQFVRENLSAIDHRTTVIVLGDARNNENDPNLEAFEQICRRARRVVWFATEERWKWGVYDPGSLSSDIYRYAPMCDALHEVTNLRQLADAIDRLFVR